jgi:hypothetical protein
METCTPSIAPKQREMMPSVKAPKRAAQVRRKESSPRRAAVTASAIGNVWVAQMARQTRQTRMKK